MQYTQLGNIPQNVSRLGFGTMRLPMVAIGDKEYVDVERAVQALHRAFELGVNYVDTGLFYCNEESEFVTGYAIEHWPRRDELVVAAKCTKFRLQRPGDMRRMLEHQLWKQRRDWFHFYLFHGIGWENWHEIDRQTGWIDDMAKAREEGLFKHCGFSFHDKPEALKRLVDVGIFDLVTCQYNYLDRSNEEAMAYAHAKGLGVVVMGPVGGGRLSVLPKSMHALDGLSTEDAAGLALRFVLANPSVHVALSGMSSIDMVERNCAAVDHGPLTGDEVRTIIALMDQNRDLARLYCTGCRYCAPCPNGVDIARCFDLYNHYRVYGLEEYAVEAYRSLMERKADASACVVCDTCLDRCPQHIAITDQLREVDAFFRTLVRVQP